MLASFKTTLPALTLLALCAGCQSFDGHAGFGKVAALYGSAVEAGAVARGQFGAVPIALAAEHELQAATGCPAPGPAPQPAQCMRTRTGQLGWLPATTTAPLAMPAAQVLHQS
jgi:hypothetical protein